MASNARHKMIEEMKKYKSKISSEAIESLAEDIIELLGGISAILDLYLTNPRFLKSPEKLEGLHKLIKSLKDNKGPSPRPPVRSSRTRRARAPSLPANALSPGSRSRGRGRGRGQRGRGRGRGRGRPRGRGRGARGRGRGRGGGRGGRRQPVDDSSSDDLNDSEDSSDSDSDSDSDNETPKAQRGPFQKITPDASWDDNGDKPAIISPNPRMMKRMVPKVRQDLKRRYSISSMTRWEDDHAAAEESYDYFQKLQQELQRKNEKSRRSIIRRQSMMQGLSSVKQKKKSSKRKKQGRSASITHAHTARNVMRHKQTMIDDDSDDDTPRLPTKEELMRGMSGPVAHNNNPRPMRSKPNMDNLRNAKSLNTPVMNAEPKRLSTAELWDKEDGGYGDDSDDSEDDLDTYARKKVLGRKTVPKLREKRMSSVRFADVAIIHDVVASPEEGDNPADDQKSDDSNHLNNNNGGGSDGGGSVIRHGTPPDSPLATSRKNSKSKSMGKSDGSSSEDSSSSSSDDDDDDSSAANAAPGDDNDNTFFPSNAPTAQRSKSKERQDRPAVAAKRPRRKDKERRPSDQVKDILNNIAPDDDGSDSDDAQEQRPKSAKSKRPKRKDKERRPSDQVKSILDNIAPDNDSSDDEEQQQQRNQSGQATQRSERPKSAKSKRPKRKDKERRPSDKVKDILNDIAPDDSDSSEDEEERRARQSAFERRRSMARRQSKGDKLLEMINNVDHNSTDDLLRDDEVKSKRVSKKDKERRPSDKVKDILNHIAPDDESSEDDEEMDHRQRRERLQMEQETKRPKKLNQRRTSDQVKNILDHIAPEDSDSSEDEAAARMEAIQRRKSLKKRQSTADQVKSILDDIAPDHDDDNDENVKPIANGGGRGARGRGRSNADKIKDVLDQVAPDDDDDDDEGSMEIIDPSPRPSAVITKAPSQPKVMLQSTSSPALSDGDTVDTPLHNTATPITNAMMESKETSEDDPHRRGSDFSGSDYSDIEERMIQHRRKKSGHYKRIGRRDSDLSEDADDYKEDDKRKRAGQRQRKKTLDKLFTNYALEDGDEPVSSPNLPSVEHDKSSGRGRSIKREMNGYTRTKSTGTPTTSKRRTSPNPKRQKSSVKNGSKTPTPSQKRSKSKGRRKSMGKALMNAKSAPKGRRAANASRSNLKKKTSTKKKGKKKGSRRSVNSPESVDSEEEREAAWSAHHSNGTHRHQKSRVKVELSADDDYSDASNSSGF